MLNILCLDDDDSVQLSITSILKNNSNYYIQTASDWDQASLILETDYIDVLLLDVNLGKGKESGLELLPKIHHLYPDTDIIVVTGERDATLFSKALRLGASDYYSKPIQTDLALAVQKIEIKRERDRHCEALYREVTKNYEHQDFIGRAPVFLNVLEKAARLKGHSASVLIEAETGTGKELFAKYIHGLEKDPKRPFIVVNCTTLPENLVESELFGHEKGSFTGAVSKQIGKFQLAHGGDVFLDEINSLKPDIQAKLLRVLQEKMVHPVGSKFPVQANCRVITATNENLKKLVDAGRFREDLYHRLNVVKFTLPPLRNRTEDIPLLVDYFIRKYDGSEKKKKISAAAMRYLMSYDWPGNVRELENQLHSMIVLTKGHILDVDDLPEHIINRRVHPAITKSIKALEVGLNDKKDLFGLKLEEYTKIMHYQYFMRAIEKHDGSVKNTAAALGVSRQWIYKVINEVKQYDKQ